MLVLNRKRNQKVVIHERDTLKKLATFYIESGGKNFKIVFDADDSIGVDRSEIYAEKLTKKRKGA